MRLALADRELVCQLSLADRDLSAFLFADSKPG